MEFRKVLALRGPNVWASFPVLEAWVDLAERKDLASSEIPGFNERLERWLPGLIEHRCSPGHRGGFLERLERGTYLAHILEHVTLELQSLAGSAVGFGRTRQTGEEGVYRVAIEYADETVARAALDAARIICLGAIDNSPLDVAAQIAELRRVAEAALPKPEIAGLIGAARARGIPVMPLEEGLLLIGQGSQQRRFLNGQSDRISAIGASIAHDRALVRELLESIGVPIPQARLTQSRGEALAAAAELAFPVRLCPRYGQGPAPIHAANIEELGKLWDAHRLEGRSILVERHSGECLRLNIVDEKVILATPETVWTAMAEPLRRHTAALALDAARIVGLPLATIELAMPANIDDVCVTDVRPGAALPAPTPHEAGPRSGQAVIDYLFPEAGDDRAGRIPVVAVTGVNGKTTTVRLTAHLVSQVHSSLGMACTEGIHVAGRRIHSGDCSGPWSARTVLSNPVVDAAVLEVARGGILREGLGFDRCDVGIVTNIAEGDHLGSSDIETPEQLAWVKSTVVAAVARKGAAVLNAADPLVVGMAEYCRGETIYFALDGENPVIRKHRESGSGRAVFVRGQQIILATGPEETLLVGLQQVPLTHGGRVRFQVENVLAACAAAWALGIPQDAIVRGLGSFTPGLDRTPARFNLMELNGVTVVLDYGHNVSALQALLESLASFPHLRRSIVYSAAGDRRDADMVQQGELLGMHFDRVILYEDSYLRGRPQGDIFALFKKGLASGKRVTEVEEIIGGLNAVTRALDSARPGELLVIQPDIIDDTVQFLRDRVDAGGREIGLEVAVQSRPDFRIAEGNLGQAVITNRSWRPGEMLMRVWGPTIPERTRHSIQVDMDRHIYPPEPLRLLNHSCEPNCGLLISRGAETIEVHALRPIAPNEELTLDYDTFEADIEFMPPCQCGSPRCRGQIVGYSGLPVHLREAYGVYIAEYLREADVPVFMSSSAAR